MVDMAQLAHGVMDRKIKKEGEALSEHDPFTRQTISLIIRIRLIVKSLSPPALWFDLFKPRGGLETAFHKL